ncbi:uncharacterized protein PHACADRAFT_24679 [Phanerochaete carnosa HHB-10118-sp]|uniref:Uncharacterized protein n=1 Tax=Phanerochaete carnosa (strain HHB-10118-sp) TaxID=650164 RepID=K5WC18_PHACS|nr:uncharacterized protein PHACADRAFT_24679 [Phanerochaete carnosa HHB-10118-sp]EKM61488.1 hypothetical protein PHACADRAFT_24679 [Phanerochaete carnosa HHB-10118-sp]
MTMEASVPLPAKDKLCENYCRILEEEVLGEITTSAYNLQFVPLAEDVVSLEHDSALREIWADGDETVSYSSNARVHDYAKFIRICTHSLGEIKLTAQQLARLLSKNLESNTPDNANNMLGTTSDKLDSLMTIDWRVDMITPLLTQLTYEGLIDEVIGIRNSHVELPVLLLTLPSAPNQAAGSSTTPQPQAGTSLARERRRRNTT